MTPITRDDTEHGVLYVRLNEARQAILEEREACAAICKQQMTGTDVAADFARHDCMTAILNRQ